MNSSFAQKIRSYLYPVKIRKSTGGVNPLLELFLYKGQWQLATEDAIYSDGNRYRPLRLAFGKIKQHLPDVKNALFLGTGLGSGVSILTKMGFYPHIDLVEIDATILSWAKELLPQEVIPNLNFICADAQNFIQQNSRKYDLIVADIFMSREVPDFVTGSDFLTGCKDSLAEGGVFILNYIITQKENWETVHQRIHELFPHLNIYSLGLNKVWVATA